MSRIIPIPTTRVGDLFVRQRLTSQVQADQLALFRLQSQVSTGQRLQLLSDDAPASLRIINLQRLLDRKGQVQSNLQASNFYLAAAENNLGLASQALSELRGDVLSVSGTLATDAQRQAVIQQLEGTLKFMVDTANSKAQGRYLFGGSRTETQPYDYNGTFVEYFGNERLLRNYVDLERLFETNLPGTEVFGGISTPVQGSVDLNPQTTDATLLSTINGGAGVSKNGAITLTTTIGTASPETTIVDLSSAVTLSDVARFIEQAAPAAADLTVDVTGDGLVIRSTTASITVTEVAQGTTAHELGVFTGTTSPGSTVTGTNLNPAVTRTTPLSNLLGTKAQGRLVSADPNNDLILTAAENGAAFNNATVEFVAGATAGNEVASYDSGTNTLTVQIQAGASSAAQVAAAINAEGTFTAAVDYRDASSPTQAGESPVGLATFAAATAGGSGQALDTASGIIVTNGGQSATIDLSEAETVEDLLNLVNATDLGLVAEINATSTGINVRSRLSGADLSIGENGGTTATQLGIRTYTGATALADLNRGLGVPTTTAFEQFDTAKMDEVRIVARNGVEFAVDVTTASSLQDVADLINADPLNVGNTNVVASVSANGNGLELVDSSDDGFGSFTGELQVLVVGGTQAAEYLGLVAPGSTLESSDTPDVNGNFVLVGRNVLGPDLMIEARDGTQLWIDLAGADTVQDVLDRINSNPDNVPPVITAQLARVGNGIELIDSSGGAGTLTVHANGNSLAAQYLGFVAEGQTASDPSQVAVEGANHVLQSEDRHTLEADSVFNTLLRLRTALVEGNIPEIGRSLDRIDEDIQRINFARAEIGTRLQNLEVVGLRLEDENVQLRSALSTDLDVDLVEAISNLTARQYAFEASLRTAASLLQTTLLNYI
jgi:flagellin-like hook-associated protein FlgL